MKYFEVVDSTTPSPDGIYYIPVDRVQYIQKKNSGEILIATIDKVIYKLRDDSEYKKAVENYLNKAPLTQVKVKRLSEILDET